MNKEEFLSILKSSHLDIYFCGDLIRSMPEESKIPEFCIYMFGLNSCFECKNTFREVEENIANLNFRIPMYKFTENDFEVPKSKYVENLGYAHIGFPIFAYKNGDVYNFLTRDFYRTPRLTQRNIG